MDVDSGLTKANKEIKCPYCGNERDKPATRQYRCKACSETIYVKRSLSNPQKRPMTYDEANTVQSETDAHYKATLQRNSVARQYSTAKSMTTLYMTTSAYDPEINFFKINASNNNQPMCKNCEKLPGMILRINKHNINNMPIPNERCINALNDEYYCITYLTTIFKDDLTPHERNGAIIEYSDYIDMEVGGNVAADAPYSTSKTPRDRAPSGGVDRVQLDEIKRRVQANEKKDSVKIKLARAKTSSQSKRLIRSCVIISIICGVYWSIT